MSDKPYTIIETIARKVSQYGGTSFFVGGYVRDKLMGIESNDIDIEVHSITADTLQAILESTAPYSGIGKSFGIFSLHGYSIDIALPRKDIQNGKGHRGFDIEIDPYIGYSNAAKRRDFTINSIMQNILTEEIIDYFDGIDDIKKRIIRHTNAETFTHDPLRVLRAAQFASRLGFEICDETVTLSKDTDLSTLSKERVCEETYKALLNSKKPSIFFEYLKEMNQLFPWFEKLHHLSDELWEHTMKGLDNAAFYSHAVKSPLSFMLSALLLHFGSTEEVKCFIKTLTNDNSIFTYAINTYKYHSLLLRCIKENCNYYTTNSIFDKVIDKEGLIFLIKSVFNISKEDENFLNERLLHFYKTVSQSTVTGKDLIDAGFTPGENFSHLLALAHEMHLKGFNKEYILSTLKG